MTQWGNATQDGSNHVTRGMLEKKAAKRNLRDIYAENGWYHNATNFSRYNATGASRS
jgi:hypothetical protein